MPLLHPAWGTIFKRAYPSATLLRLQTSTVDGSSFTFSNNEFNLPGCLNLTGEYHDTAFTSAASTTGLRSTSKAVIIAILHVEDSATTFGVTSCTLGGVAGSEAVDRGGGTSAINTAIYWWYTGDLVNITNSDVVVTPTETVTSCTCALVRVDNIANPRVIGNSSVVGTGDLTDAPTMNNGDILAGSFMISATTNNSAVGTEQPNYSDMCFAAGSAGDQNSCLSNGILLYSNGNAEHSCAAMFYIFPQFITNLGSAIVDGTHSLDWSGATSSDEVCVVWG